MHVYFVRHGETFQNKKKVHQAPNAVLTPRGREMVVTTAEALRSVHPDLLITSEYTRARESARIIGLHTGLTPVTNGFFYEIVRPSKLFEKSLFHPETFLYVLLSIFHRNNSFWRYKDAENLSDVTSRAQKALQFLESHTGAHTSIVVVSHAVFINIMVAYLCQNKMLRACNIFGMFFHVEQTKNASITHLKYNENVGENTCAWEQLQ